MDVNLYHDASGNSTGGLTERELAKTLCCVIIFIVITVFTALPIVLSKWFYERGETGLNALRIARCFGGGAFLGAFLLHVTPEVMHLLGDSDLDPHYPFPTLFIGGGFFAMMFLEKAVHMCTAHDHGDEDKTEDVPMKTLSGEKPDHVVNGGAEGGFKRLGSDANDDTLVAATVEELTRTIRARTMSGGKPPVYHYESKTSQSHAHSHNIHLENAEGVGGFAKGVVLLFALSLDCVMEGMALGLQDGAEGAYTMMIAILSHEFIIGFTLGLQLLRHNSKSRVLFLAIFYGVTCPIGIAVGTLIMEVFSGDQVSNIIPGVFQAITGGVFLYCTFFEILADEISSDIPLRNILSIGLGFTMMALLMLVPHGHEHGDGDHDHSHGDHPEVQPQVSQEEARRRFLAVFRAEQ